MPLVVVAVEEVEPLSLGGAVLALVAQSPTFRNHPLRTQLSLSTSATVRSPGKEESRPSFRGRACVPLVARHQGATGRGADCVARITIGEAHALLGHAV